MKVKGGRPRTATKLQRRIKSFEESKSDEFGDGKRRWFRTEGHQKLVCYRRPGSHK